MVYKLYQDVGQHFTVKAFAMKSTQDAPALSPVVSRITAVIDQRIRDGSYAEGEWLPTERALAEEFEVSRMLIRAAIKELERQQLISCATHRRPTVLLRRPHKARISSSVSRNVALWVCPAPSWPATAMTMRGVQQVLTDNWRLVVGSPTGDTKQQLIESEQRFLRQILRDRDVDGLIIEYLGGQLNLPTLEALKQTDLKIVFMDHEPPAGIAGYHVGVDNRRSTERAVKHLVRFGHEVIGYVSNFDDLSTVANRLIGYQNGLKHAGIECAPDLIMRDPGPPGDDDMEGCEQLVEQLMCRKKPPTAILTVNDVVAFRVLNALKMRGIRVPQDVSLIGFDGIERWSQGDRFLTTSEQPFQEMGTTAAELLFEAIERGEPHASKHILLDAPLKVYSSVARIPTE